MIKLKENFRLKARLIWALDSNRLASFLSKLAPGSRILDVGCGNHSVQIIKNFNPTLIYTGIDVANYNIDEIDKKLMDSYVVVPADDFAQGISQLQGKFDAIISVHNIEHCSAPIETIRVICDKLAPDGKVFFTFPSIDSVKFPSRKGTLNFFDDGTHKSVPDPKWFEEVFQEKGVRITYFSRNERGRFYLSFLLGMFLEPISMLTKKVFGLGLTWNYWGFQTVIMAEKG
jgi:SAM-dependent methyltransferase